MRWHRRCNQIRSAWCKIKMQQRRAEPADVIFSSIHHHRYLPSHFVFPFRTAYTIILQKKERRKKKMSVQVSPEQMATLKATLLNTPGNVPLHERFRALFMLKAVGGHAVVDIISEGKLIILWGMKSLIKQLCCRSEGPFTSFKARACLRPRPASRHPCASHLVPRP